MRSYPAFHGKIELRNGEKMRYRTDPVTGNKLSALGFGCMRFPRGLNIDMEKTEKLIMEAIAKGVNYFDTAYIYPGNEAALGGILHKNDVRGKVFVATKLPFFKCGKYEDFDRIFNEQLDNLKTGYIDYYLMHNMSGLHDWQPLAEIGIEKWIAEKKARGQIRSIGFSFHGPLHGFIDVIDAYGWDFCQIQYNYMNETYQAGRAGLLKAHAKGLPVIVMEPLLGGKLAAGLPKKAEMLFKEADPELSPAAWALKWLFSQPEVTVVLSGMNDPVQLADNINTAEKFAGSIGAADKLADGAMTAGAMPDGAVTAGTLSAGEASTGGALTAGDAEVIGKVRAIIKEAYKVPCTGCNYCMPCPHHVNIPGCFNTYNSSYANGYMTGILLYLNDTHAFRRKGATRAINCVKCGLCEKKCPQHIKIPDELVKVKKRMEPFWFAMPMNIFRRMFDAK